MFRSVTMMRRAVVRAAIAPTQLTNASQISSSFASSAKKSPPTPKPPTAAQKQQKQQQQQKQKSQQIPEELDPELLKGTERIDADSVTLNGSIDEILQKEPDFLHWFVQIYVPAVAESVGDVENDESFDADKFVSDGYKQWEAAGKPRVSSPKFKQ